MKKNYLPSKKFIYSIITIVILGILFFIISGLISKKNHFSASNKKNQLQTGNLTINDLLKKDSDGDGVADWEEALWGTDINNKISFNETPDAIYIKNKKDELKLASGDSLNQNNGTLNETDKFAREFFASLSAMKQSGQIDKNTINNVSASLGRKIVDPMLIDKYSEKDIKLDEGDGIDRQKIYYQNAAKLFEGYEKNGVGSELEMVSNIVVASSGVKNDPASANKLEEIANSYQEFAQKMTEIPVPESLIKHHIEIINNANNTGISVRNMIKIAEDPIIGLSGLAQYQKYSDDLISSVEKLQAILLNNGIIIQ